MKPKVAPKKKAPRMILDDKDVVFLLVKITATHRGTPGHSKPAGLSVIRKSSVGENLLYQFTITPGSLLEYVPRPGDAPNFNYVHDISKSSLLVEAGDPLIDWHVTLVAHWGVEKYYEYHSCNNGQRKVERLRSFR